MGGITPMGTPLPAPSSSAAQQMAQLELELGPRTGVFASVPNPAIVDGSASFLDPKTRLLELGWVDVRATAPEATRDVAYRPRLFPWVVRHRTETVPRTELLHQATVTPSAGATRSAVLPADLAGRARDQGITLSQASSNQPWLLDARFAEPMATLDAVHDPRVSTLVDVARWQADVSNGAAGLGHRPAGALWVMSGSREAMTGASLTLPTTVLPIPGAASRHVRLESLPFGGKTRVDFVPLPGTAGIYVDTVQHAAYIQPHDVLGHGPSVIPLVDVTGSVIEDAMKLATRAR